MNLRQILLAGLLLPLALGCDFGTVTEPSPTGGSTGESSAGGETGEGGIKRYTVAELVSPGDPLPPLDEGRVEISPPKGWTVLPRSRDYVTGFFLRDRNQLPRIIIDGAEETEGPATVTADGLPAFVKRIETEVLESLSEQEQLIEPVRPLILGDNPYARYVRPAKIRMSPVGNAVAAEQMFLVTVIHGRRYTIRLQVVRGKLLDARDACYAVGAHLRPAAGAGGDEEAEAANES